MTLASILAPVTQRVRLMAPRDRWLLLGGGMLLTVFFIHWMLIAPMRQELARLRENVPADRAKLAKMQVQAGLLASVRASSPVGTGVQESLRATVEKTAEQRGLRTALRQFQDNAVSVQFSLDDVEADALLRWLEELSSRHGIRARSVQMELLPQTGRVRATLVLRGSTL